MTGSIPGDGRSGQPIHKWNSCTTPRTCQDPQGSTCQVSRAWPGRHSKKGWDPPP
ncbi:hypothetical protein ACVWW8_002237, partial [Thermostichus sp. MS-CIW-22]